MATLYIIATPIGNLSDISARAIETLKSVDYIACEDTRTSGKLLNHYGISGSTFSFHQHNEHKKVDYLMELLEQGKSVGLISDAGMPGISDPGFLAVREAHTRNIRVCVIPGADALTTALVASGLPCDRFVFEGFLPVKKGRQKRLTELIAEPRTMVFYESPHRIVKFLKELIQYFGEERMAAAARELTKKFEEIKRAPLVELHRYFEDSTSIKGEFVIVVSGAEYHE